MTTPYSDLTMDDLIDIVDHIRENFGYMSLDRALEDAYKWRSCDATENNTMDPCGGERCGRRIEPSEHYEQQFCRFHREGL